MALNKPAFKTQLIQLAQAPAADIAGCAAQWAAAVATYFMAIVPLTTTVSAAQATLQSALAAAFAGTDPASVAAQMEAAFLACATTIGGGMAGYVPTPPVTPIGFAQLFTPPYPETHDAAAEELSSAVHTWAQTGFSTLAVAPFTVVPWN